MKSLVKSFKYLLVLTLPVLTYVSFTNTGWLTFLPFMEAFILIPVVELLFKPDAKNLKPEDEKRLLENRWYDWMVYSMVPIQIAALAFFLYTVTFHPLDWVSTLGRVSAMGIMCGVIGINVAHELGHRKKTYEQWMSKILLLTSLYMHFYIEHNRGHHRHVSTPEDPATSRKGETVYAFWFRSIIYSYLSAWHLETERLQKAKKQIFSLHNEMLRFQLIQLTLISGIGYFCGWQTMLLFLVAAIMGILLLETVNYIEHYGLQRTKTESGYERVQPWHSWNSNHIMGRLLLFELSRHSDHHYIASRKYQVLRHIDESPQMPTGYPGMILLALLPPLWFKIMHNQISKQVVQSA